MASYDNEGFDKMRQEALERVKNMQRHNKEMLDKNDSEVSNPNEDINQLNSNTTATQANNTYSSSKRRNNPQNSPLTSLLSSFLGNNQIVTDKNKSSLYALFDSLNIDEEKVLIGMLIYVLAKNGSDVKLLIALGYLLL